MVKTKVFVGNLAFTLTEAELAQEFEKAGKVGSANIITRGPRSLGYGFVEFDNEQDAHNAVKLMDKKELGDPPRPINVEVAKPREEGENKENAERSPRRRTPKSKVRKPRNDREEGKEEEEGAPRPRRQRAPRREEVPRAPSITTLFVANLPFSLTDETFAKVFQEGGIAPKSATVARSRNGLSKGFGFVEFGNEADQKKALNVFNQKEVEGRQLQVKIALTDDSKEKEVQEPKVVVEKKEEKKPEKKEEIKKAEPKKEEPKKVEVKKEEPKKEEPKKVEVKKEEPKKAEPKKEEPKKEEPKKETKAPEPKKTPEQPKKVETGKK